MNKRLHLRGAVWRWRGLPGIWLALALFPACSRPPAGSVQPPGAGTVARPAKAPPPEQPRGVQPDGVPAACAERDHELARQFRPFLDAFFNIGGEISPDGKLLLFRSNRGGGAFQLHTARVSRPDATATPIAKEKDRVTGARFTPDGKHVVFTRDKDADENTQIYRATWDGKRLTALTAEPGRFHTLPRFSRDGRTMVYLRGAHGSGDVSLVTRPFGSDKARTVATFKGYHSLDDLSRDGKKALLCAVTGTGASKTLLVDWSTAGEEPRVTQLAPSDGVAALACPTGFSFDERSALVTTNEGADRSYVVRINLRSRAIEASYRPPEGEIVESIVSDDRGQHVALALFHGSHTIVKILAGKTLKETVRAALPLGRALLDGFTKDGSKLIVSQATSTAPWDLYQVNVRTGQSRRLLGKSSAAATKLAAGRAEVKRIPSFDELQIPLNVYLPDPLPAKRLPVIVRIHGGPTSAATLAYEPRTVFCLSRGFAVVEPNIRGSAGFGKAYQAADNGKRRMDAIRDVEHVNRWLREQPWADPSKLVIFGGSYGGYVVYMALAHQPDLWAAGVGFYGVVNLVSFLDATTGAIRMQLRDEFGELPKDRAFLLQVSPITAADRMNRPLFVFQGAKDPRVPRRESDLLVRALRRRQIPVEYMVAPDEGHSLAQRHNKLAVVSRSMRFIEQHLGLPGPAEGCRAAARRRPLP